MENTFTSKYVVTIIYHKYQHTAVRDINTSGSAEGGHTVHRVIVTCRTEVLVLDQLVDPLNHINNWVWETKLASNQLHAYLPRSIPLNLRMSTYGSYTGGSLVQSIFINTNISFTKRNTREHDHHVTGKCKILGCPTENYFVDLFCCNTNIYI